MMDFPIDACLQMAKLSSRQLEKQTITCFDKLCIDVALPAQVMSNNANHVKLSMHLFACFTCNP